MRVRGAIDLTRLVARIRILPAEAESDLDSIVHVLKTGAPRGVEMLAHAKEPIAYGLHAIVADIALEDEAGQMDRLEEFVRSVNGVGEIDVFSMSRQSVKMKSNM
jgi:elongation factor 1-beta